ncbi:sensor histidine kinase [Streptomyces sp. NPDC057239]|uniref:sensor histidine kinase n=1 Tax=Streptomyces sp. NPDC057239 TaxID=3346061 RepID=UPI0036407B16
MECGLSRAVAALSALFALNWSGFLLSGGTDPAPDVRAVALVFLAQAVVTAVRGARVWLSRVDIGVAVVLALLGPAVLAVGGVSRVLVGQRCLLVVPAVLLAAALLPRRARRWTYVLAIGAQIATSWPADGPAGAVEGVWPVVATAVAGDVLAPLMRTAGDRADRAQQRVRAARAAAGRAAGRREAHRNFQGVLHDEVSTALQAIGLPGVPEPRLREAAAEAVAALAASPAGPDRDGRVDLTAPVRALPPPSETVLTVEAPDALHVPPHVADAVVGAAREALRNIEKHAAARTVRVRLRGTGGPGRSGTERDRGFWLSVTDDGAGFPAGELAPSSVGLRRSVIRRMDEVGGGAEVRSAPGRGTTVRLEWHPPTAEPAVDGEEAGLRAGAAEDMVGRMRAAVGDVRRPLAAVCLPFLAAMGIVAVVHVSRSPDTSPLLAWYTLLAGLTVALLLRADSGIPGYAAGAACGFAVAGVLGSFLLLPLSALRDFESWPVGAVTPLLTLLVIVRPAWEALTALVLEQTGIVVLVVTGPPIASSPGGTVAVVLPALFAPALGVLTGLAIGRTVARLGGVTARAEAARSAMLATEAARRAREELHRERLAHLGEEILPLLAEVGSGRCAPDDPGVRDRARLLSGAVRDELQLPGVLDRTVRELLAAVRRAGCAVVIQSDSDDLHPPTFLRLLLATALTCGPVPREVFLTVNAVTGAVHASLVVIPGDGRRARALSDALSTVGAVTRADVVNSDTSTWVEAAVRAP